MTKPVDARAAIEADCEPEAAALIIALATEYLATSRDRSAVVSAVQDQRALAKRFDEEMPRRGRPLAEVAERIRRDVIPDSNWLYHPRAMGHQVAAPLPAAIWSESLIAALNQSVAVFEMSPVGTTIERRVVRWMCDLVGFGLGAAGTMTTGGTEATFTAFLAARAVAMPDAWENGVGANPPILVCSEHAHYAITRPAGELGLGARNVVTVASDGFRMSPRALRDALVKAKTTKRTILAVSATAGSTPTGTFDDLAAIADVCDEFGVWLHVDAAHGGSALLSSTHRPRLKGIERARSIAWDPHKMMLLPLQAGVLLVRDSADLDRAYAQQAPYLFHNPVSRDALALRPTQSAEWVDQGTRSFLCSRRADALKVWIALQRYGADGIGSIYDHLCATTAALHQAVERHPNFDALHEPNCNILCFRWVGDRTRDEGTLDEITREARERYNRSGAGWVTTTVLNGRRVLRVTVTNPRTTREDVEAVLNGLDETCEIVARST
jgi:L-2,4-diaminobutyrate decarboxylase